MRALIVATPDVASCRAGVLLARRTGTRVLAATHTIRWGAQPHAEGRNRMNITYSLSLADVVIALVATGAVVVAVKAAADQLFSRRRWARAVDEFIAGIFVSDDGPATTKSNQTSRRSGHDEQGQPGSAQTAKSRPNGSGTAAAVRPHQR